MVNMVRMIATRILNTSNEQQEHKNKDYNNSR